MEWDYIYIWYEIPEALEAVECLSKFYMAVAFYDVIPAGWQKSDPRIRNLKIPFEKVQHYREVKKVRVGFFWIRL